jgi:acetyl esterase/lipase
MLYSLYRFSKNYIHEADYEKPRASPLLYKSFNKVPPALIIMAELDMNRVVFFCSYYQGKMSHFELKWFPMCI